MTSAEHSERGSGMAASFGQMWLPSGSLDEHRIAPAQQVETAYPVDHAAMLAIVHLRDLVAEAEHGRDVAVAALSEQLDAANARVATLELAMANIELLPAAANSSVGMVDFPHQKGLNTAGKIAREALAAARAATGPIGGVA